MITTTRFAMTQENSVLATRYDTYEDIPRPVRVAIAKAIYAQHKITPPPSRDDLIAFWGILPEWLDKITQEITPDEAARSELQFPPDKPES